MPPNDVINDLTVTMSCVHLSPPYIRYTCIMLTTSQLTVCLYTAFVVKMLSLFFIIIVSENVNNLCSLIKLHPYSGWNYIIVMPLVKARLMMFQATFVNISSKG